MQNRNCIDARITHYNITELFFTGDILMLKLFVKRLLDIGFGNKTFLERIVMPGPFDYLDELAVRMSADSRMYPCVILLEDLTFYIRPRLYKSGKHVVDITSIETLECIIKFIENGRSE